MISSSDAKRECIVSKDFSSNLVEMT
jgi:hypothetical protein